jgi:hypothetical protein
MSKEEHPRCCFLYEDRADRRCHASVRDDKKVCCEVHKAHEKNTNRNLKRTKNPNRNQKRTIISFAGTSA